MREGRILVSDMAEGEGSRPPGTQEGRPGGEETVGSVLARLAERLRSIGRKAEARRWPGWTDEDRRVLEAAAQEIASVEESLRVGMREAFEIGRQYGKGEDVLARLDEEIAEATDQLARVAWGSHATHLDP